MSGLSNAAQPFEETKSRTSGPFTLHVIVINKFEYVWDKTYRYVLSHIELNC